MATTEGAPPNDGFMNPKSWPQRNLPIKFLAIDGHGGSGKSTLAGALANKLSAEVIRTDDFASWDNSLNWWPLLIRFIGGGVTRAGFRHAVTGLFASGYQISIANDPNPLVERSKQDYQRIGLVALPMSWEQQAGSTDFDCAFLGKPGREMQLRPFNTIISYLARIVHWTTGGEAAEM